MITGKFSGSGSLKWNGLILVIGKGDVDFGGLNIGINGGLYVVNDQLDTNGVAQFGTTKSCWTSRRSASRPARAQSSIAAKKSWAVRESGDTIRIYRYGEFLAPSLNFKAQAGRATRAVQ